jgi:D-glycero-D-manno-heptose 1,7-bisphosphate phosphatase
MSEIEVRRAVFLDRDGVLNVEGGYVVRPEDLQLLPGAAEAVARLSRAGWAIFVFTNQAGVGRGYLTLATMHAIHERLKAEIARAGGTLTGIYACPHHPDDICECRKPKPGMLLEAAREHGLDLSLCWAVGDSPRDIAAAQQAGCHTILVLTGHTRSYDTAGFPAPQPDHVFADLAAAAEWLCHSRTTV